MAVFRYSLLFILIFLWGVDNSIAAQAPATDATSRALNKPALTPVQLPPSSTLEYDIAGRSKGINYTAKADIVWKVSDSRYEASSTTRAFLVGSRIQTSQGHISTTGKGLLPLQFNDQARRQKSVAFDYGSKQINFSPDNTHAPLVEGVQDRLSLFMQLAGLLAASPQKWTLGSFVEIPVASTNKTEIWKFKIQAPEILELPSGNVKTVHLQRVPRENGDSQLDLWFAPDAHYLPVRIKVQQDDGTFADQQLRQSTAIKESPKAISR